ncbi:hypothetical protein ACFL9T_19860 [Thermodesulfobacteriota bacterium]
MGERIFVLYKLKANVSREEYAKWLNEEHFVWGRGLKSITNLRGFFVTGDYDQSVTEPEWTNISIMDVNSREEWYKDMQEDPGSQENWGKFESYVEKYKIFFSESIHA